LFPVHAGTVKLFGWFGGMQAGFTAPFLSQIWIGGVLEVFGGAALMAGLVTRPVAFLLSGEMAVAYWQFHAPHGAWPILNHGEPAVLLCFIFLWISAHDPGPWSLDRWLARGRRFAPRLSRTPEAVAGQPIRDAATIPSQSVEFAAARSSSK
jgi:putative oxidoreductase